MQLTPFDIHQRFWQQRDRAWLRNDFFNAVLAFLCDITLLHTVGTWKVAVFQIALYTCKVAQLAACSRWYSRPDYRHSYWHRTSFIVAERLLRDLAACHMMAGFDQAAESHLDDQYLSHTTAHSSMLIMLKTLIHGNGSFAAFWHTMLIPVPWALEVPLQACMAAIVLTWRVRPIAAVLEAANRGAGAALPQLFTRASRSTCSLVASMHGGSHQVCQLAGPHASMHLAVTISLFSVFALPLYIR
jgi:hypothetical protein